ncbi:MAG: aldolase [Ramlibacter sp.]|nr:aldolase [Ramlibacter sp.]
MLELIQITNDPQFAERCDALDGMRLWVDLERLGKAQRQAGRNTFISTHQIGDVGRIKAQLRRSRLMVRVNPLNAGTAHEVQAVLDAGADMLMLPMFDNPSQLEQFLAIVDGRVPVSALLETAGALASIDGWIGAPGLAEAYVGLNDLHLSLGRRFMFEPLAEGSVDRVAELARARGIAFGFGGTARLEEGLLPGRDVLAEHLRLGSGAVILSRTFHTGQVSQSFEAEVASLRATEAVLALRSPQQAQADSVRIAQAICAISATLAQAA